jgi:hypothetical protein
LEITNCDVQRRRERAAASVSLVWKIESLESKYDEQFNVVFDAIRQLIAGTPESNPPQRRAGFHP